MGKVAEGRVVLKRTGCGEVVIDLKQWIRGGEHREDFTPLIRLSNSTS